MQGPITPAHDLQKTFGKAVANVGVRMGARQVFGFIFAEIWFSVKEELERVEEPFSMEDRLNSIGEGVRRGVKNAKEKYKDLIARFGEGLVSGALASLTTTLCNIFFYYGQKYSSDHPAELGFSGKSGRNYFVQPG